MNKSYTAEQIRSKLTKAGIPLASICHIEQDASDTGRKAANDVHAKHQDERNFAVASERATIAQGGATAAYIDQAIAAHRAGLAV